MHRIGTSQGNEGVRCITYAQ